MAALPARSFTTAMAIVFQGFFSKTSVPTAPRLACLGHVPRRGQVVNFQVTPPIYRQ